MKFKKPNPRSNGRAPNKKRGVTFAVPPKQLDAPPLVPESRSQILRKTLLERMRKVIYESQVIDLPTLVKQSEDAALRRTSTLAVLKAEMEQVYALRKAEVQLKCWDAMETILTSCFCDPKKMGEQLFMQPLAIALKIIMESGLILDGKPAQISKQVNELPVSEEEVMQLIREKVGKLKRIRAIGADFDTTEDPLGTTRSPAQPSGSS